MKVAIMIQGTQQHPCTALNAAQPAPRSAPVSTAIVPAADRAALPALALAEVEAAKAYAATSRVPSTRRTYAAD